MSDTEPTSEAGNPPLPPVIDHAPDAAPLHGAPHPDAPPPDPVLQAAPVAAARRRAGTPLPLTLLLAAGLGGGLYWVWANPKPVQTQTQSDPQPAIDAARAQITAAVQSEAQAMGQQMQALAGRVDALEKRPAQPAEPAAPGVSPDTVADQAKKLDDVAARVDALSAKQDAQSAEIQKVSEIAAQRSPAASPSAVPAPDTTAQQVPGLIAQQQAADLSSRFSHGLADQKAALDQAQAQQAAALDALGQRLAKLEQGSGQASQQALQQGQAAQEGQQQAKAALTALNTRVDKLEQGAGQAQSVARDASRAVRIEAAQSALAAGQPLGPIPDAPPALARFATAAPPTEAALREDFPRVAAAVRAASQPDLSHRSFLDRALARVQQSVTVRRGDRVLVGDPASGLLARAQEALGAGDLKGAAGILGGLNGGAAAAARDWVDQVHALLDARASLAAMARG